MKIILLGGTKDSINIIQHIKEKYNTHILTTTTTEYGAKIAKKSGSDETIAKPLLKEEIIKIIKENNFNILIDATHPFASHITQTSTNIANELKIPYIRFERPPLNLNNINTKNIHTVESINAAGKLIKNKYKQGNILHFAGSNTMEEILKHIPTKRFYPRILNIESSIKKCEKLGITPEHQIFMNGVASKEENIKLIEKYSATAIITKESGETGGVIEKIEAANEKNIAIIMIRRPKININEKNIMSNLDDLDEKLKEILKKK